MKFKNLLMSSAIPVAVLAFSGVASAQVTIDTDTTTPVQTSSANTDGTPNDVDITTAGTVTVTSGTAVTIDSDNRVTNAGTIRADDTDDAVGVNLVGGNTGNFTNTGTISLAEDYTPTDDDNDGVVDGPFAQGSGRTGILISGAAPVIGNVDLQSGGTVAIEGNNSFALRLLEAAGLTGNITNDGRLSVIGANSFGISIEDQVIGNLANSGSITVQGENSSAISITGDIDGAFSNTGSVTNTGYRFTQRPNANGRALLGDEDLRQGGSAIIVNNNISGGINLGLEITEVDNGDGTFTDRIDSVSSVSQFGGAPAILIDGQGNAIAIGDVSLTEADDQYAFINRGTATANGLYNDINATVLQISDANLSSGINNSGTLNAVTFRSGDDGTADADGNIAHARVIVFGSAATADAINNSGLILASTSEASDEIYADENNILGARILRATAIDIAADASLSEIRNSGGISAVVTGRTGEAVAIIDRSGTVTMLENSGSISALGVNSDPFGESDSEFNLIAIDLSANTSGVTFSQVAAADPGDGSTPPDPVISGDVILGSGDDVVTISAGLVSGGLDLGAGADTLSLSGGSSYTGAFVDADGLASLSVTEGSTFTQTAPNLINVGTATFDGTSVFQPTLDGATGQASTIVSTGDITFADGASIAPILQNVVSSQSTTFQILNAGGALNIGGDVASLASLETPFLYNTTFGLDPNDPNTLIVTLDLRSTEELGLDSVQTASFTTAFEALQNNSELANAFVNIRDGGEFNQAINQLLPEFAAAARQFVVANVDGSVGAVGTHLDNMRRSQDKPGGVWIQEFAYFADRDLAGLSEQYRGYGFGLTGGIESAFGPFHSVGLNFGFASTEIEDVVGFDDPLDVVTLQLGTYAGLQSGDLGIELYAGGGYNDFEQRRVIEIGNFTDTANGNWSGTHLNGSLKAGYDLNISEKFWARPSISVDYLRLTENAYQEDGAIGIALDVDKRTSELGGATAMMNLGAKFDGRRTWVRPAIRFGYRNEFINDGVITSYGFAGLNQRSILEGEAFPSDGFLVGLSLAAGSKFSSFGLDFDSDIRDGFIRHTGRLVVRLIF